MSSNFSYRRLLLWITGFNAVPVGAYCLFDATKSLPKPFDQASFPFLARFYIRRALQCPWAVPKSSAFVVQNLAAARDICLRKGTLGGACSPQATLLMTQMAIRMADDAGTPIDALQRALDSLLRKPHVGILHIANAV